MRRVSELHGPNSEEMIQALKDVDDVLQAKLIDVRSKEEGRAGGDGLKVNQLWKFWKVFFIYDFYRWMYLFCLITV